MRELRPHAEWWAIEKLQEKLCEWIAESVVIVIALTIVQKIRGIPFDWWVLGALFVVSFGFLVYSHRRDRRPQVTVVPEIVFPLLPPISLQDVANREKISVLFRGFGQLASSDLQDITSRIIDRLNTRGDGKDKAIAELVQNTVHLSCNCTHHAMLRVLEENQGMPELQRHLEEFVLAYHKLGYWMIKLLMDYDVAPDAVHEVWRNRHEQFHHELRRLLATDDFSKSRERLGMNW